MRATAVGLCGLLAVFLPACSSKGCDDAGVRAERVTLALATGDLLHRRKEPVADVRRATFHLSSPTTLAYGDIDISLHAGDLRGRGEDDTTRWDVRREHDLLVTDVVALGDRLAVTGSILGGPEGEDEDVVALVDPGTGRPDWTTTLPWPPRAVDVDPAARVVVAALEGTFGKTVVVAIDADDGGIAWEHTLRLPQIADVSVDGAGVDIVASDPIKSCG